MIHEEQQRALDYLARKGTHADVATLRAQVRASFASIERELDDVPADRRNAAPPGKWSAHDILDHLVLSHEPAVAQLASLLRGSSPPGVAIPAGLHDDVPPSWDDLRARMASMHRQYERLLDEATDAHSLEPKAMIEMVVKVDCHPLHWFEQVDWKAFIQAVRVHTLEHREQLRRAVE